MKTNVYQILALLLLTPVLASAQGKFSVSITAAPAYSHTNTRINLLVPDGNGQTTMETFSTNTSAFGYGVGAMAHFAFTPKWSISTGFQYNRVGTNSINPFDSGTIPARIISRDFQVPLLVNYRLTGNRLSPYFSVGSLANFRKSTIFRSESNAGPEEVRVLFGKSAVDYRAVVGAGVSYKLTQHWSLIAQPLLIWRFKPSSNYEKYTVYQVNGQFQLMYSL